MNLPAWAPLAGMAVMLALGIAVAVSAARIRAARLKEEAAEIEMKILLGDIEESDIVETDTTIQVPWVSQRLKAANWNIAGVTFVAIAAGAAFVAGIAGFATTQSAVPAAAFAAAAALVPFVGLSAAAKKANDRFGEQLMAALPMMCALIKGGSTIQQATVAVSENLVEPASGEFARIAREMSVGMPLDEAIRNSAARMDSRDMDHLARAVAIHSEHGGELSGILETAAESIRARVVMRETLKSKVSQPKMEAYIVTALPWILFAYFSLTVPSYVRVFWEEPIGWLLIAIAAGLDIVGFLLMRRLIDMKLE